MNIALVGFGKMGKLVFDNVGARDKVVAIIDPYETGSLVTGTQLGMQVLGDCDVVIDFSHPSCVVDNIIFYGKNGIPAVIGTTGWYDRLDDVKQILSGSDAKIIYSGNFSIGVSLFMKVVEAAAQIFNGHDSYDVMMNEIHHRFKADSPSGTARMLAQILLDNLDGKDTLVTEELNRQINRNEIHVSSTRGGYECGTHTVTFDSSCDTITLSHRARNREGFALGALEAAAWIVRQDCGIYTMEDMLND